MILIPVILLTSYLSYATIVASPTGSSNSKLPTAKGQEGANQGFSWFNFFQGNQHQSYTAFPDTPVDGSTLFNLATVKNQSGTYEGSTESPSRYYAPAAASALFEDNRATYFYQHVAADTGTDVLRQPYHDAGPASPGIYYGSEASVKSKKNASVAPPHPVVTPIPATVSLLGSGLLLLGLLRKRYFPGGSEL